MRTCYRHPERRAGVICQRCDRPICPDCMHQASVGFHCPECTRQSGQRVVRGRPTGAGTTSVTSVLIAINVAVFVFGIGQGLDTRWAVIRDGALLGPLVAAGDWWRIVSSGFLHANVVHIGFNMFVLYQLGRIMEPALGKLRYALVYAVSLLAGALGVLILEPDTFTVGASGAVFGLMGAAVAAMRSRGINPFQTGLGTTLLLNLFITFSIPGISIGGHVGGLVGGFLATWVIADTALARSRDPRLSAVALLLLGLAVGGACLVVA